MNLIRETYKIAKAENDKLKKCIIDEIKKQVVQGKRRHKIALYFGISEATLSEIIHDKRELKTDTILQIAERITRTK